MNKYRALEDILQQVQHLMEDILQSGFETVQGSTVNEIKEMADTVGQYGLEYLCQWLKCLIDNLEMGRHRTEQNREETAKAYGVICEYLYMCRQKVRFDEAEEYYSS